MLPPSKQRIASQPIAQIPSARGGANHNSYCHRYCSAMIPPSKPTDRFCPRGRPNKTVRSRGSHPPAEATHTATIRTIGSNPNNILPIINATCTPVGAAYHLATTDCRRPSKRQARRTKLSLSVVPHALPSLAQHTPS